MDSHKELKVWQQSMDLVEKIYKVTEAFPNSEQYGLVSQMRRSAVSIPSNIAEGYMRGQTKEYVRFLRVSLASAAELETQLILSKRLNLTEANFVNELQLELVVVMKMLNALITKLKAKLSH